MIAGANDVMDPGHKGPVMAYLKKVSDATKDSGVGNGWFKIQEEGFSNGKWGTDTVINSGGNQQIKIPDCIEDGQYLLRAEMVALHGARSTNGAQLYVSTLASRRRSPIELENILTQFRWNALRSTLPAARPRRSQPQPASPAFTRLAQPT